MEGRRAQVARDVDDLEPELVAVQDGDVAAVAPHGRPAGDEQALGVVAAVGRLGHRGGAVGGQAGEQHARLDLRAGDRQLVVGRAQVRPVDGERREAPLARDHARAHALQRLGDAVDGAPADRLVAVERVRAALLPGEPAGQQPQQRPGVADVDRQRRLARLAHAAAADDELVRALLDQRAERAHRVERRVRVGGVEVVADADRLVAHRGDDRRAVRQRLVGRRRQLAAQAGGRGEANQSSRTSACARS